jgi:hypothetical protein
MPRLKRFRLAGCITTAIRPPPASAENSFAAFSFSGQRAAKKV